MAHFYGIVQGARGKTSRLGTKQSGLTATANGWYIGAHIILTHKDGKDHVQIYKTNGSGGSEPMELITEFSE